jgi:Sec-independent protein translocase protein TatA
MKILEIAGELLVLYILYKFIFEFLVPVYQATKQVKKKMGEMQQQMNRQQQQYQQQQQPQQFTAPKESKSTSKNEDYIEFEEVK